MCIGIPAKVVALVENHPQHAWVDVCGVQREVNIALVCQDEGSPEELIGSWVLIHVGFAMSRLDEQEAQETLSALRAMGEVEEDVALFLAGEGNAAIQP